MATKGFYNYNTIMKVFKRRQVLKEDKIKSIQIEKKSLKVVDNNDFPTVGIGASEGGLEAFEFF